MADSDLQHQFVKQIASLMSECRASGLGVDDFIAKKLSESEKDGVKYAEAISHTLAEIDTAYDSLLNAKQNGQNRQEWLRDRLESAISDTHADHQREEIGQILARTADMLRGEKPGTSSPLPFEGIDAVDMVSELEDALVKSAIAPVAKEMEEL